MKNSLLIFTVLMTSILLTTTVFGVQPGKEEQQLWNMIKDTKDIGELDIYLETYPEGYWIKKVVARKWAIVKTGQSIKQIEAYVRNNPDSPYLDDAENTIWQLVKSQDTIAAYHEYIKKYPKSRYRQEAEESILVIEERNAWLVVKKNNTIDQLSRYIKSNPDSRFTNEAHEMLWHMVRNAEDIEVLKAYRADFPGTRQSKLLEEKIWHMTEASNDTYRIKKFLAENPDSRYRGLAKLKLMRLQKRAATLEISETLILDRVSQLIWHRRDLGTANWDSAGELCHESRLHDWEDWRLPLKDELRSLFNVKHFLPDFTFTNYWTATTYHKDEKGAWMVEFNLPLGKVDYKKNRHHVLCVRDLK